MAGSDEDSTKQPSSGNPVTPGTLPPPLATLWAIPKAMEGSSEQLQRNAFRSWRALLPSIDVVLVGNEKGLAESAAEFGFRHTADVRRNQLGTPLVNSALDSVRHLSAAPVFVYSNADIIFGNDLIETLRHLQQCPSNRFLGIGQRWESSLVESCEDWTDDQIAAWLKQQRRTAARASILCKDYFIFPRHLYLQMPDFAVGRGNWDNWMVHQALVSGAPIVELTQRITAVHQPHNHAHVGGRGLTYFAGVEAKENQRLAGGTHWLSGSHATHFLNAQNQLQAVGMKMWSRAWQDAPRFAKLVRSLWS